MSAATPWATWTTTVGLRTEQSSGVGLRLAQSGPPAGHGLAGAVDGGGVGDLFGGARGGQWLHGGIVAGGADMLPVLTPVVSLRGPGALTG